jgi:hypothetical protein
MKNNTDPIIQNIKTLNNNTKRIERDDGLFFEGGLFRTAELFLIGFSFLEVFVVERDVI